MPARKVTKRRTPAQKSAGQTATQARERPVTRITKEGELVGNLYDNMDDDSIVVVHRFDPDTAKQVLMYKLLPDEATDIEIQRLSGGGKYTTREHVRNEAGQMVFGRQRTVVVSGPPKLAMMPRSYTEGQPQGNSKPEVGTTGEQKGTTIDDVLTAGILRLFTSQAEASETQAKMYQTMLAKPQMDWGPIITAIVPLLTSMIERKDNAPNPMEMIEKIASLMKTNTNPTSQFKDMLETVDSVFSIKDQAAGPPPDPLTAMATQLPKILEIVSSEQKKGRTPSVEEVQRRLTSQPNTEAKPPMYQLLLNRFAPMIKDWAVRGQDPVQLGEFMVSSLPERYHGAVREFLAQPDSEEIVYQTIPDLRNYPDFANKCFGTMADMFEPEEEEIAQPTDPGEVLYEVGSDGVGQPVGEEETGEEFGDVADEGLEE